MGSIMSSSRVDFANSRNSYTQKTDQRLGKLEKKVDRLQQDVKLIQRQNEATQGLVTNTFDAVVALVTVPPSDEDQSQENVRPTVTVISPPTQVNVDSRPTPANTRRTAIHINWPAIARGAGRATAESIRCCCQVILICLIECSKTRPQDEEERIPETERLDQNDDSSESDSDIQVCTARIRANREEINRGREEIDRGREELDRAIAELDRKFEESRRRRMQ
jgi:hypothetical protein